MRLPSALPPGLLALGLLLAHPRAAGAQEDGGTALEHVDALARAGLADRARAELLAWWDSAGTGASRGELQQAIWLRGLLTVDPSQATLDYQRLVVEYPGGTFSDRALLRLARAAEAREDVLSAAGHYRELAEDYPGGLAGEEARTWLARHEADVRAAEAASGAGGVGGDGRPRPDTVGPAVLPADTAVPQALPPAATAAPVRLDRRGEPSPDSGGRGVGTAAPAGGDFTVQLGAFRSADRARMLLARARSAGFDARLVRVEGSDLVRVRVGRYRDLDAATRLYDRVRARGFDATVSADAGRETGG